MLTLDGKAAIVTGGSRGIGFAIASGLAAAGAKVIIAGTDETAIAAAAQTIGMAVIGVKADVRVNDDVTRLFTLSKALFDGVDILVNNAGIGGFEPVERMSLDQWRQVIATNLTGAFLCTRQVLPLMRARGGGWIINISSLASTAPFARGAAYCASKAGLNAFTESLMQEVRHDGIRVAAVLPGSVGTGFMRRTKTSPSEISAADDDWKLTPEDVARTVLDLLGHHSRSLPSRVEIRPSRPPKRD